MRWAALSGLLLCLPCLIPVLMAAGIGSGMLSVLSFFLSPFWIVALAAAATVALIAGAALLSARRRARAACDPPLGRKAAKRA